MLCSKQENGQLGWSEAIRPSHLEMLISLLVSDNWPILTCWLGVQTYKRVLVKQIINIYTTTSFIFFTKYSKKVSDTVREVKIKLVRARQPDDG